MRNRCATSVLAAMCLLIGSGEAKAQFWPGYGYYPGYGAWGGYASAVENSTTRYIAEQSQLQGQRAALAQSAALQGGIRTTLRNQAETRTQDQFNRQTDNRDWWFQVQQQQLAQRRAASAGPAAYSVPAVGFESVPVESKPAAATDVIKWLPILRDPAFAAEREKVEAPYRRAPSAAPTEADYQGMIDAAGQMKATLERFTADISAQDYLTAQKFLDQLIAEARERIGKK